jgi:hypothetical protein
VTDASPELHVPVEEVDPRAAVLVGLGAHLVAEGLLEVESGVTGKDGLDGGRGDVPVAHADNVEGRARLHEVSFDPVFGTNQWVEVLTHRVSQGGAARLLPAVLPTPVPRDGRPGRGEAGLVGDAVAVAVTNAEVV